MTSPGMIPASRTRAASSHGSQTGLFVALGALTVGGMVASCGIAKLFAGQGVLDVWAGWLTFIGAFITVGSAIFAIVFSRKLPRPMSDCAQYGRHMVGLTLLLLVIGLCNSVATSTLALAGGLGFSAATLIEASDPARVTHAEAEQTATIVQEKRARRALRDAQVALERAGVATSSSCANSAPIVAQPDAAPIRDPVAACRTARLQVLTLEDEVRKKQDELEDAEAAKAESIASCVSARQRSRHALFFLLSVSAMMSLFGAAFYVVNTVRGKRSLLSHDPSGTPPDAGHLLEASRLSVTTTGASTSSNGHGSLAVVAGAPTPSSHAGSVQVNAAMVTDTHSAAKHEEPFDVHAFWSGAFFRIGEAMLFTFAFFWLIWTSASDGYLIWMPVLGLFVGMFVKTGETIIFRLGMRILSAAEEFLPLGSGSNQRDASNRPVTERTERVTAVSASPPPQAGTPEPAPRPSAPPPA